MDSPSALQPRVP